jgi:hypothetical protein
MTAAANGGSREKPPLWLFLFCFALMGPACGINAAFVALAIPAAAPYGIGGLIAAGAAGFVLGLAPARWLARKIHEGLREE